MCWFYLAGIFALLMGVNKWILRLEFYESYNDIHTLNLQNMKWKEIEIEGDKPPERYSHSATLIHGKMYIFGGMQNR
jgi:hypothetical protein